MFIFAMTPEGTSTITPIKITVHIKFNCYYNHPIIVSGGLSAPVSVPATDWRNAGRVKTLFVHLDKDDSKALQ